MIRSAPNHRDGLAARRARSLLLSPAVAALLCGCSGAPQREAPVRPEAARGWGDRTVAITYPDRDPVIAYFAPAAGESGRLFVWDGGEDEIARGDWRLDGGRLCMSLAVYRKQSERPGPLKGGESSCVALSGPWAGRHDYRGDVFGLDGKAQPPYILSRADNERIIAVLAEAERIAR